MFRLIFVLAFFAPTLVWSQDTLEIRINPEKALAPMVTYERLGAGELRVAVTVSGVPVGDLGLKDLEVRSELSQYELRSVEPMLHTENAKVSIILCIDNSQSMTKHVPVLKETLEVLLRSLGPSVKIASVFFQENYRGKNDLNLDNIQNIRIYGQTRDKETVRGQFLKHLHNKFLSSRTYLYDEIYAGMKVAERIRETEQGRYVIVLSDGLDNASKQNRSTIRGVVERNPGIIFYTIDYLTKTNPFLEELAEGSGGRHFRARKAEELGAIFEKISRDIIKLSGYRVTYRVPLAYLTGRVSGVESCEPLSESSIACFPVRLPGYRTELNVDAHGIYSGRLALPHRWRVLASAPEYFPDSMEVEVAEGRGISDKYDNETEEGRASNRRTDVIFFDLQEVSERLGEKR